MEASLRASHPGQRNVAENGVVPGDALLHPALVLAIGLLILNDQVLKQAWPSWWTGKISDFCGLLFFPLVLQALWEVLQGMRPPWRLWWPSLRTLRIATLATGAVFAAVQLWPPASEGYRVILGWLQWPFGLVAALFGGAPVPVPHRVALTPDPTDLIALPALVAAYLVGRTRIDSAQRHGADGAPDA